MASLFMTSGSWGGWFDKVTAEDVLHMPIRFVMERGKSVQDDAARRIVAAVTGIQEWPFERDSQAYLAISLGREKLDNYIDMLNEAVFDLFELSKPERDLVRDFFGCSFDFLNMGLESVATKRIGTVSEFSSGTIEDISLKHSSKNTIGGYVETFLNIWNAEIGPEAEFMWQLYIPERRSIIAVSFDTKEAAKPMTHSDWVEGQVDAWDEILKRCEDAMSPAVTQASHTDRIVRIVTDTNITIIKRNEARLWTRSAAREDAEATFVQAMQLPTVSE
jgi:hypothetical protein